jgi:hypothetical protein
MQKEKPYFQVIPNWALELSKTGEDQDRNDCASRKCLIVACFDSEYGGCVH